MIFERSLAASVREHAALTPEATALLAAGRPACTYRELDRHLERVRTVLSEAVPGANRVIAVAAANGPELLSAIVAAMSCGVCAPVDPAQPQAEIDAFLADVSPSFVLADDAAIARHAAVFARHGIGVLRISTVPGAPAGVFQAVAHEPSRRLRAGIAGCDDDVVLLMRTSGTTAAAKIVPHTESRLNHVFNAIVNAADLGPADRCLSAMPLYHVHGITWVTGASLVAGASVVLHAKPGAAALVDALRTFEPTWYSASPAVHREVLAHLRRTAPALETSLRFIRTGAAPIDRQLVIDLEAALGAAVLDGYGTTEALAATLNPPQANKPGSAGLAVGCEIAIFDGEVAVRGANVASCYAGSARAPISDPVSGWYRTGDAGYLDDEGYLYVTGRLNELINVGGEKIAPLTVEAALLTHPAIIDAVAFALPHPTLGQHVAAAVVLRTGSTVAEMELFAYARHRLPRHAVPNVVRVLPSIPRDGSGKVSRRELTARYARDPGAGRVDSERSRENTLLHALTRIWEDALEDGPVALDENFFVAGGDSLRAIEVMMRIEADLGVTMPLDTLLYAPTVATLANAVLAQAGRTRPSSRIVAMRATGARPPLFFYDGDTNGGGLYTRMLAAALDPEQPIYIVRPNGALGEEILENIEAMADADAAMIAAERPSPAYRLAGFCSGGIVALEVARRLEGAGAKVDVVAMVASSAPNAGLERLWALTARAAPLISERAAAAVYRSARSVVNALRTGSAPPEVHKLIAWWRLKTRGVRAMRQTPDFYAYREVLTRYFPKRYDRTVDVIWANDDPPVVPGDPSMGWRRVTRVRRHSTAGDHTTMLTDHVDDLGATLRRIFAAADGAASGP